MSVTYTTGSLPGTAALTLVTISNTTLSDFNEELVDVLGSGNTLNGFSFDGTTYIALLVAKRLTSNSSVKF